MTWDSAASREPSAVRVDDTRAREAIVFAKVRARLIPFMFLLYVVNYLDRVNIGFAALQMNRDLGFSPEVYGYGAGIFFWGYLLFEVPSNLLMERVGARLWIARIMIGWGLVSASMLLMRSATAFYIMRFVLGVAEAGFFPGMILYLTYWFPASQRAKAIAQFMTATAIAGVIGGPLSGSLLALSGTWGLAGWQWLFLMEGVPSVVLGVVVFFYLTDRPEQAHWLTDAERGLLVARMREDREARGGGARGAGGGAAGHDATLAAALSTPRVWLFALIYFTIIVGFYGIAFWLPQILKNLSGLPDVAIGFVAAIPYVIAAVVMVLVGGSSDRTGERRYHVALPALVGCVALVLSAATTHPVLALLTLSMAAAGIWGALGPFWALPTTYLSGTGAAAGIALINSIGNLGGFLGPSMIGWVRQQTGSFSLALLTLAVAPLLACLLVLSLPRDGSAR
jgi:ACS family tartrate transporter-like MFS transporter